MFNCQRKNYVCFSIKVVLKHVKASQFNFECFIGITTTLYNTLSLIDKETIKHHEGFLLNCQDIFTLNIQCFPQVENVFAVVKCNSQRKGVVYTITELHLSSYNPRPQDTKDDKIFRYYCVYKLQTNNRFSRFPASLNSRANIVCFSPFFLSFFNSKAC